MPATTREGPSLASTYTRVALLDLLLLAAGVFGWAALATIEFRVLTAVLVVRGILSQLVLHATLAPVRRWRAAGSSASDAELLAADEAVQSGLLRFAALYALGWVLAPTAGFAITVAAPALGTIPARAEYAVLFIGTCACLFLSYSFMLALVVSLARGPVTALSREINRRQLGLTRKPRLFADLLRRFLTTLTAGLLFAALVLGGKGRIDGQRAEAVSAQQARLARALAVQGHGQQLEPGIERLSTAELPASLTTEGSGATILSTYDPGADQALAAIRIADDTWLLTRGEPDARLDQFLIFIMLLTLALALAANVSAVGITRVVTEPLAELGAFARRMREVGDIRDYRRPSARHNDEVGSLTADFTAMLDSLEQLASAAEAVAVGDLRVVMDQPGDLHEAFRVMLVQLHYMVVQLRTTALDVTSATAEIHATMRSQDDQATQMAADVEQTTRKVQSLANSARNISTAAEQVQSLAEQSLANVELMAAKNSALRELASGIGELLAEIREIADRSDLLALNGSLEATRSGEAGRGFALVAAEMRRLAERVTATVEDVRAQVTAIEAAGAETSRATEQGRRLAKDTAEAAHEITELIRVQDADTHEVERTTTDMASFVLRSTEVISQTTAAAEGLQTQVAELELLTEAFHLDETKPPE